jgi:hypothetical protein
MDARVCISSYGALLDPGKHAAAVSNTDSAI